MMSASIAVAQAGNHIALQVQVNRPQPDLATLQVARPQQIIAGDRS
jgi:hypothetical protein